jgi:hypothetical protein
MKQNTNNTKTFYNTTIPSDWGMKILGDELDSLDTGVSVNSIDEDILEGDLCILKTSAVSEVFFIRQNVKK